MVGKKSAGKGSAVKVTGSDLKYVMQMIHMMVHRIDDDLRVLDDDRTFTFSPKKGGGSRRKPNPKFAMYSHYPGETGPVPTNALKGCCEWGGTGRGDSRAKVLRVGHVHYGLCQVGLLASCMVQALAAGDLKSRVGK